MPSLIHMPEVAMTKILAKLDFPDVQSLRKTCWDLRNTIDDLKPDPRVLRSVIRVDTDFIDWKLDFDNGYYIYPKGKFIRIQYNQVENGCQVIWYRSDGRREKFLENMDFLEAFCLDFEANMKFQQSELGNFIINFEYFKFAHEKFLEIESKLMPRLQTILSGRDPLKTKNFSMVVFKMSSILAILPYLNAKTIKRITMTDSTQGPVPDIGKWRIDELMELPHWKNAVELDIIDVFVEDVPVEKFLGFKRIYIFVEVVNMEQVLEWKEAFLNFPTLDSILIKFSSSDAVSRFISTYGDPVSDIDMFGSQRKCWFFKVPSVQVSLYDAQFRIQRLEEFPENGKILNNY
ncbi:hypothetical protein GCK72_021412 [Caenorhabditis remanei]|uniref:F-box domain-containing protein n=1 Tax=Caenorhabditis remanei TaxID=31234 RepID=A0A6A5GI30_CAERE|nr:hypothetical protein GCK72_021412 [Caenorhabditis remanei]KAF1754847.1 hypothetical protein GCK72_021412 [Caenorhabditis remanei]